LGLHDHIAWDSYCPVSRLGEHVSETVVMCGLVVEQRTHHQITGEPMKFLTLADWTGVVETELFAQTYRSYAWPRSGTMLVKRRGWAIVMGRLVIRSIMHRRSPWILHSFYE